MNNPNHTLGPWHITPDERPKALHPEAAKFAFFRHRYISTKESLFDDFGEVHGEIVCTMSDGPNQVANARLIAAAPELLEALEAIVNAAPPEANAAPGSTLWQARRAIAKAKGTP